MRNRYVLNDLQRSFRVPFRACLLSEAENIRGLGPSILKRISWLRIITSARMQVVGCMRQFGLSHVSETPFTAHG